MRIAKYAVLMTTLLLLISGCSKNVSLYKQANKHYKAGDYEAALDANARSLLIKPSYVKAQDLLKEVYPKAVKKREDNIKKLKSTGDADMWDHIVPQYAALVKIQDTMADLPRLENPKTGEVFMHDHRDYRPQLKESQTNAAEYHYQLALRLAMQSQDPDIQKEAAKEFKQAMSFVPDYKDTASRYEQSRRKAVKRIAIMAFENKTSDPARFAGIPDMLESKIVSSLIQDKGSAEFLEIISREKIDAVLQEQELGVSGLVDESSAAEVGQLLGAHEILSGKILKLEIIPARVSSVQLKESATVEIEKGEADSDDDDDEDSTPVKIKQDVQCLYFKYTKTASVRITASYTIVEVSTGKIKTQDTYTGTFEWTDSWARKDKGDDRALTPATKALIAKTEPNPPSETQMIENAMSDLSQRFISQIKQYVK